MTTGKPSVRTAAEVPHPKWGAFRTGARSDSSHCTDGLNPVVFHIERIDDKALDAIERIEEES